MGMLDRYKKSGGFSQLLSLIESFGPQKQEKFLNLIDDENPAWAKALREKVLTIDRIFSWSESILAEIAPQMNVKNLAIALHGLKKEQVDKLYKGLPNSEKRKIELEFGTLQPNANEVAATHAKLIETVRQMIMNGELRAEKFDLSLVIDEKFEESLMQMSTFVRTESTSSAVPAAPEPSDAPEPKVELQDSKGNPDLKAMQTLVLNLQKENKSLRGEVKVLRDKLDQIRKIA